LAWVIVATIVIQLMENNLLVPRVMRKAVGVNPFVSLLAIFCF
jgi:predicted PurR-regulated permease PerM